MTRQEIFEGLSEVLIATDPKKKEAVEKAAESSALKADLGLDSIGMLYTAIGIEERFGVRLDDLDMDEKTSIGSIIDYIEEQLG